MPSAIEEFIRLIKENPWIMKAPVQEKQQIVVAISDAETWEGILENMSEDFKREANKRGTNDSDIVLASKWGKSYKQLKESEGPALVVSYILFDVLGMFPYGKTKGWLESINDLWEASGMRYDIVRRACERAKESRAEGITISSPRSIISFARNEIFSEAQDKELTQKEMRIKL